jgi:MFS family permease
VLFFYTLAMVAGSVLSGNVAGRVERAGLPAAIVPIVALVGVVAIQLCLIAQPHAYPIVLMLFLAMAILSAAGSVGYVVVNQMFPADLTGRVSTATNTVALGLAFALQAAIGWILDLWPRTSSGGWDPDGYSWALAMTAGLQTIAALVMATAMRRGHS